MGLGCAGQSGDILPVPYLLEPDQEGRFRREQADQMPSLQLVFSLGPRLVSGRVLLLAQEPIAVQRDDGDRTVGGAGRDDGQEGEAEKTEEHGAWKVAETRIRGEPNQAGRNGRWAFRL